jgi:hypothetical protein
VDTFAKLRRERKGVELVRDGVNSPMSSSEKQSRCWQAEQWSAVAADRQRAGHLTLNAAQLAQSERRAECGASEISRLRRENDRLRMERDVLKRL